MPAVECQALQCPPFQAMWPDDRPAPLRIRAFTSESYEAIKKRENKKRYLHKDINTEQRSIVWNKKETGEIARAEAMGQITRQITRMDSGPQDVVLSSDSRSSERDLLVVQDGGKMQLDDELQHEFSSPCAVPISSLEGSFSGEVQFLAARASPAMSHNARGSDSEVFTGVQQEWELFHDRDPDARTASPDHVHMITDAGDASTFDRQREIGTHSDTELAVATSSYPTPADSSATGHRSDSCEQLTEDRSNRSPSLVSLKPNSEPVVAAATGLKCLSSKHVADEALAEVLPDEPSHTVGVGRTVGSLTCPAGSEPTGWIEHKSTPQSAWTSEQDEHLLHLRDMAQLSWRSVVSYFPGMTLDAMKGRYKYLNERRLICQIVGDEPKSRLHVCRRTTDLATPTSRKAGKKYRAPSKAKSRKQPTSILAQHHSTLNRRHVTKQTKTTKDVASLAAATHEDACQRTSRCGRPIRHPFRHRAGDGYF